MNHETLTPIYDHSGATLGWLRRKKLEDGKFAVTFGLAVQWLSPSDLRRISEVCLELAETTELPPTEVAWPPAVPNALCPVCTPTYANLGNTLCAACEATGLDYDELMGRMAGERG